MVTVKELHKSLARAIDRGLGNNNAMILINGSLYNISKYHCETESNEYLIHDDYEDKD